MAEKKEKAIDNDQATKIPAGAPKDTQLSDEDLEKVAGGVTPTVSASVIASVIGTAATAFTAGTIATATKEVGW